MSRELISRAEAKSAGLKHYFTGKPCCNNHTAERKVSNYVCVECEREWQRKHYQDNPEAERKRGRDFYNANRLAVLDRHKKRHQGKHPSEANGRATSETPTKQPQVQPQVQPQSRFAAAVMRMNGKDAAAELAEHLKRVGGLDTTTKNQTRKP